MATASTGGTRKLRLFVSLNPPLPVVQEFTQVQSRLRGFLENRRLEALRPTWVKPTQFHLTLSFLGDVPEMLLPWLRETLDSVAGQMPPLELRSSGFGCFPVFRNPRVIWAGIEANPPLQALQKSLVGRISEKLQQDKEGGFFPHLTLARVQNRSVGCGDNFSLSDLLKNEFPPGDSFLWQVDRIWLMESHSAAVGSVYSQVHAAGFAASGE